MTGMLYQLKNFTSALVLGGVVAVGSVFAVSGALAQDATQQQAPQFDPDKVVAKVGDSAITELDLIYAIEDLGQDIAQIPPQQRRQFVIQMLVDMKVMAQVARDEGMAESEVFERRKAYLEDRALRRAYLEEVVAKSITDEEVKAEYDAIFKDFEGQEELRARHILVETEEEAQALVEEINGGADFAETAKEKSTGPSGAQGGDLGYFKQGDMVPEFYEAANALQVGDVSAPVQSQFGWHVIKLEDRKAAEPPALAQVEQQVRQRVLAKKFEKIVADNKENITVEIVE
ncbi:peptidylprolyl isomerase [Maritalea myrionectae]|uniref:Parvulin-like PPIase n=1 Tax=Maritalea myrionectae TaxID=454601 RepID=A0A2R4MB00_9HYPH|nr:peptidylprolyl isomerase [Maritalea myrionectae]AVX03143.1 peptidylprolyl isomerase [Maritalea myrionectae]